MLVEVAYSTVNYKDGLAVSGKGRIARKLPMVAGIDLAGTVVESRFPDWKQGDKVVANGWGMSETVWGGYAKFQRLKPEWLTRLPDAFSLEEAMGIGTAGYTAALASTRWRTGASSSPAARKCWSRVPPAVSARSPWRCSPSGDTGDGRDGPS